MSGHSDNGDINFWPGYVDAMTNLVLNLLFIVGIFAVAIFVINLEAMKKSKVQNNSGQTPSLVMQVGEGAAKPKVSEQDFRTVKAKGAEIASLMFANEDLTISEENSKKLTDWANAGGDSKSNMKVNLWVAATIGDQNNRQAYLRIMSARSALISAGLDPQNISVRIFDQGEKGFGNSRKVLMERSN